MSEPIKAPAELMNPRYEDAKAETEAFMSKMQERFGVHAILVCWQSRESRIVGHGASHHDGDQHSIYGMAKRYCVDQEARWAHAATHDDEEEEA